MDDAFLKGIAPAFITLTGTIVFGLVGGWFKRHLERRSVRYALVAEIQALALIVRERRYLPSLLEAADKLIRELRGFHAKSGSDIFAAR